MASVSKRQWTHKGVQKEAWVVRYKDIAGTHRSRQFDRKKEADTYCRQVENELDEGTHVARRDSRTVECLIDEYLKFQDRREHNGEISIARVRRVTFTLGYFKDQIGNLLLRDMKWQHVEKAFEQIRKRKHPSTGRTFSGATVRGALSDFSHCVGYGVRRQYAARNVVQDAMKEIGRIKVDPIDTFSREEVRRVIEAIEVRKFAEHRRKQDMQRCLVYLAAFCALRRGEIFALTPADIDFEGGRLLVSRSLNDDDDVLKEPKTRAGIREVPLPAIVAAALRQFWPQIVPEPRGLIFRTRDKAAGVHLRDIYRTYWYPLLERAGIAKTERGWRHFHALRHFAGSAWLDAGVPLADVSRMMGHANTQVTAQIYAHAIAEPNQRAGVLDACASALAPVRALLAPAPVAQELRNAA